MKSIMLQNKKVVQDLAYFKKEALRKVAKEQFEKLQRLGLNFPIVAVG